MKKQTDYFVDVAVAVITVVVCASSSFLFVDCIFQHAYIILHLFCIEPQIMMIFYIFKTQVFLWQSFFSQTFQTKKQRKTKM